MGSKEVNGKLGFAIEDDALDDVTGGRGGGLGVTKMNCPVCKKETKFDLYSGTRAVCRVCGYTTEV